MIYWILHKKISVSDWTNKLEGEPGFFFKLFDNLSFIDISSFSLMGKIENTLNPDVRNTLFDITKIDSSRYFVISNKHEFKKYIDFFSEEDIFVFQAYKNVRINNFCKLLNKYGLKTALLNHWQTPSTQKVVPKRTFSWLKKTLRVKKRLLFLRFLTKIHDKFVHFHLVFDYSLSGGKDFINEASRFVTIKNVIPVHSISYDEFLSIKQNSEERLFNEKYFVFIDQALTIHPEFTRFTDKDTVLYRKEILSILNKIEAQYNTQIIIAEHPRMRYADDFWDGRLHFQGKTANLLKYCEGAITHFSGAINVAYLFGIKQKIFLTSSSPYFYVDKNVEKSFMYFGGILTDMKTEKSIFEKSSSVSIENSFSLIPNSEKSNRELFTEFLSKFNKK